MNTKAIALVVVGLLVGLAVLLVVTKPDSPAGEGTLIYARTDDSTTLDPQEIEWGSDVKVAENIYEGLVRFAQDPTQVEGVLAEKWEASPDGLAWTFHLRADVRFQDGTEFDSSAVRFAFDRLLNASFPHAPKLRPYASMYEDLVQAVETPDSRTVVLRLATPSPVFLYLLSIHPAMIPSPAAVQKFEKEGFARHPVGTGPYRLAEWKTREKIVLERNDDYWGKRPALQKIVMVPVEDTQTAIQKLQSGECHLIDLTSPADVEEIAKTPDLTVAISASPNVAYLAFNMTAGRAAFPYNDIHFRRAVSYAIDRKVLVDLVYYGQAVPAANIVPPILWRDAAPLPEYEYDLDKAKAELAQVALPEGFVAEIWHPNFPRDYMPYPDRVAEFLKDQLAKIGLAVRVQSFDKGTYSTRYRDRAHPMCLLGWMADYPDADNFLGALLHGRAAGDNNITFFDHPEFNRLVSEAASRVEWEERKPLYEAAVRIYRDEKPSLALVHTKRVFAMRKGVRFVPHPIDYRIYQASLEPGE